MAGIGAGAELRRVAVSFIVGFAAILSTCWFGATVARAQAGGDGQEAQPLSWLYAASADSGTLEPKRREGDFRLELRGVPRSIVAFTDRPARVTTNIRSRGFFANWKASFANDPPNAALDFAAGGREHRALIFELQRPHYSKGRVTLDARLLDAPEPDGRLAHYGDQLAGGVPKRRLRDISLFIDNGPDANDCGVVCNGLDCAVASGGLTYTELFPVAETSFDCQTAQDVFIHVLATGTPPEGWARSDPTTGGDVVGCEGWDSEPPPYDEISLAAGTYWDFNGDFYYIPCYYTGADPSQGGTPNSAFTWLTR